MTKHTNVDQVDCIDKLWQHLHGTKCLGMKMEQTLDTETIWKI